MSEQLPFLERVLRVTHSHIVHRALPPTRFEPWTETRKGREAYRQYVGYRCINTETDEVGYCYLVPDFSHPVPSVRVYYGFTGDPDQDQHLWSFEVVWDA